jgi:hypothetical protein
MSRPSGADAKTGDLDGVLIGTVLSLPILTLKWRPHLCDDPRHENAQKNQGAEGPYEVCSIVDVLHLVMKWLMTDPKRHIQMVDRSS